MHVVSLYDFTGFAVLPFARRGYQCFCYDKQHKTVSTDRIGKGTVTFCPWDATENCTQLVLRHKGSTLLAFAFPPCTDLAVSGSAWFASKKAKNPRYLEEAMELVYVARDVCEALEAPYLLENPVSVISTQWRKPDTLFHPNEYGGYLPERDRHPTWPEVYPPRDAYTKKTCFWTGGGFVMPPKRPVVLAKRKKEGRSDCDSQLGGKSLRTKNIRSATPRGVFEAIAEVYA